MTDPGSRRVGPFLIFCVLAAGLALSEIPWPAAGPPLPWRGDVEKALDDARAGGRPALVSFHADWCAICARLDRRTLTDPGIAQALDGFELVRVDATVYDRVAQTRFERFGVTGIPALVFVNADGEVLARPRSVGFVETDDVLAAIERVRNGASDSVLR